MSYTHDKISVSQMQMAPEAAPDAPISDAPISDAPMSDGPDGSGMSSWGIRDFAAMFDVTPRTIRFYEDKGLLSPSRDKNMRVFGPLDQARFEKIMRAKRLGFTLDDIKEVLDVTDGRVTSRSELLRRKRNFETVIRNLQHRREDIDSLARDMHEICDVITRHVETVSDSSPHSQNDMNVFDLAAAYEARFAQSLVDDFAPERSAPTK